MICRLGVGGTVTSTGCVQKMNLNPVGWAERNYPPYLDAATVQWRHAVPGDGVAEVVGDHVKRRGRVER